MSASIQLNEWELEDSENRINNEAYVMKIKNFELLKDQRAVDFTGDLSLIHAIKLVYDSDNSCNDMRQDLTTVLVLSQTGKLDLSFKIIPGLSNSIVINDNVSDDITKKEYESLINFKSHIKLMLDIWKNAITKRWQEYFELS